MRLRGVTEIQLNEIIERVNGHFETCIYANFKPKRGRFISFTLRLSNSRVHFHRLGQHDARRMVAVCWHGHHAVMAKLFSLYPYATLVSSCARYDGAQDFMRKHEATAWRNMGSQLVPTYYIQLCECNPRREQLLEHLHTLQQIMSDFPITDVKIPEKPRPDCSRCDAKGLENFFTGKESKRAVCPACMKKMQALGVAHEREAE